MVQKEDTIVEETEKKIWKFVIWKKNEFEREEKYGAEDWEILRIYTTF